MGFDHHGWDGRDQEQKSSRKRGPQLNRAQRTTRPEDRQTPVPVKPWIKPEKQDASDRGARNATAKDRAEDGKTIARH
jgi:hypothetical protein